jgi:hypothetical protein
MAAINSQRQKLLSVLFAMKAIQADLAENVVRRHLLNRLMM